MVDDGTYNASPRVRAWARALVAWGGRRERGVRRSPRDRERTFPAWTHLSPIFLGL